MSAGTDLAADLGYVRALAESAIATPSEPGALDIISHHALRLLDALEAVLALAGDWQDTSNRLGAMADRSVERGALPERAAEMYVRAQAHDDLAQSLLDHLSSALSLPVKP